MIDQRINGTKQITNEYSMCDLAFRIGEAAVTGMLYEVSSSPSPGLVSPFSNGIHRDMDFFTFLRSTASISHVMALCAQVGINHDDDILARIRKVGITAERHMINKTGGVNTQRGILFAAGVVSAAAGRCAAESRCLDRYMISEKCAQIARDIVKNELENAASKQKLTNGERVYVKYGISGIRGELQGGLLSAVDIGIPLYETALQQGCSLPDSLAHALIGLMSVVDDTVVINRAGMQGFHFMRQSAKEALAAGGMLTEEGKRRIHQMECEFIARGISPGGAADMLAVSVMMHELEKIYDDYELEALSHA